MILPATVRPMRRPLLLDLYCGAGGASMGYHLAGFDVIGIDLLPQPNYPFRFIQGDITKMHHRIPWHKVHAIAASPPCSAHTWAQRIQDREHPNLIPFTRRLLQRAGKPYVIENVEGAPLRNPVRLCGATFRGIRTYRHRMFEASFPLYEPRHREHKYRITLMGRAPVAGEYMHIVGNFIGAQAGRDAMGIQWMLRDELRNAIPPAYTRYIGRQLIQYV